MVVVETATLAKTGFLNPQWLEETACQATNEGTQLGKLKARIEPSPGPLASHKNNITSIN
eukprot:10666157-Heterocapsa_arctica.AAC.1